VNAILTALREKAQELTVQRGPKCSVCSLPPEVLEGVRTLRSEKFQFTTIAGALKTQGVTITGAVIAHHFRDHEQNR